MEALVFSLCLGLAVMLPTITVVYIDNLCEKRKTSTRRIVPLVRAAADLANTIANISDFELVRYLRDGNELQRDYVLNFTAYRISKYFRYHYLVFESEISSTKINRLLDDVRDCFETEVFPSPIFHLFGGYQKLLAETVSVDEKIISFHDFLVKVNAEPEVLGRIVSMIKNWVYAIACFSKDSVKYHQEIRDAKVRMIEIQKALTKLAKYLDRRFDHHQSNGPDWKPHDVGCLAKVLIENSELAGMGLSGDLRL